MNGLNSKREKDKEKEMVKDIEFQE